MGRHMTLRSIVSALPGIHVKANAMASTAIQKPVPEETVSPGVSGDTNTLMTDDKFKRNYGCSHGTRLFALEECGREVLDLCCCSK